MLSGSSLSVSSRDEAGAVLSGSSPSEREAEVSDDFLINLLSLDSSREASELTLLLFDGFLAGLELLAAVLAGAWLGVGVAR